MRHRIYILLILPSLGFVIDRPDEGFPSATIVSCIEPIGYRTNWRDQIRIAGRWKNLELMGDPSGSTGKIPKPRCIDPLQCYHPIPKVPSDYTVEIVTENQVDLNDNSVNRSLTFKCTKDSKYILTTN